MIDTKKARLLVSERQRPVLRYFWCVKSITIYEKAIGTIPRALIVIL